jgi:low affinity Fe/Cu permease
MTRRASQGAGTDVSDSKQPISIQERFRRFASSAACSVGSPVAFLLSCLLIAVWAVTGPYFHFSDTWQLVINTGTTVITFLMVFLIQNTQNRDAKAIHLKLDELIRSAKGARNHLVCLEDLTDDQLAELEKEFAKLRDRSAARTSKVNGRAGAEPVAA